MDSSSNSKMSTEERLKEMDKTLENLKQLLQFQLDFLYTHKIFIHSVKIMMRDRDQLFLQLYYMALVNSVKQGFQLLPKFMSAVNSTNVKPNISQDIGHDDPHDLILLSINTKYCLILCWIQNHNLHIFPHSLTLHQVFHLWCPCRII